LGGARALLARTRECTPIVRAVLVRDCVATAIICDAHVDLLRIDLAAPKGLECRVNLLEIGMWFDLVP
jgi:hypothetical protein